MTVKPLTAAGMVAAQVAVRRSVEPVERQARERSEAGLPLDGLPDLSVEGERDGFYQAQLIRELAVRHITSWTGVELEGGPPSTPENILPAVVSGFTVAERPYGSAISYGSDRWARSIMAEHPPNCA